MLGVFNDFSTSAFTLWSHHHRWLHVVMAVMIRSSAMDKTCPGPSNSNLISTTRDLSVIASDNLTYQLLCCITPSTFATVSSHILSYVAIYGYMTLNYYRSYSIRYVLLMGSRDLPLSTRRHEITRFVPKHASKAVYQNSIARH
jgi:hypothetical protein